MKINIDSNDLGKRKNYDNIGVLMQECGQGLKWKGVRGTYSSEIFGRQVRVFLVDSLCTFVQRYDIRPRCCHSVCTCCFRQHVDLYEA